MRKTAVMSLLVVFTVIPPAFSQKLKDFLHDLGKQLQSSARDQVNQQIDHSYDGCRQMQSSAEVSDFDLSRIGTWKVTTASGRKYQLRSLSIAGNADGGQSFASLLGLATAASFQFVESDQFTRTYVVHLTYADLATGKGAVGQILASALNNTYQKNMANDVHAIVLTVGGKSLDDRDWCLTLRDDDIRSAELINQ